MKGNELIKLIKDKKLEDFQLEFIFTDGINTFPNVRSFRIDGLADIGYSDKRVLLEGKQN